jgi:hypothetical protein
MMKAQKGLPVIGKPFFVPFDARHGRHATIVTRCHDSFITTCALLDTANRLGYTEIILTGQPAGPERAQCISWTC